jgi:hypothetical protein
VPKSMQSLGEKFCGVDRYTPQTSEVLRECERQTSSTV